jgi:hypothetical protein
MNIGFKQGKVKHSLGVKNYLKSHAIGVKHSPYSIEPSINVSKSHDIFNHTSNSTATHIEPMISTKFNLKAPYSGFHNLIEK